ncbi:MAG: MBL fold metallo-hydrolase, partial [Paraclostridium sp.]
MQAISNLKHRLDFFGYGGYADAENSSAMIDLEGSIVLIDCGNTVGKTIEYFQHNKYRINDISIIITHMHADHVGGLPTLLQFLKYNTETKVRIITTVLMEQSLKCLLKL